MPVRLRLVRPGEPLGWAGEVLGLPAGYRPRVNVLAFLIEGGVLRPGDLAEVAREATRLAAAGDASRPVVITGRGPLWLYAALVHAFHFYPVVAVWDPRLRAGVVVQAPRRGELGSALGLDGSLSEPELPGASSDPSSVSLRLARADGKALVHFEHKTRLFSPALLRVLDEQLGEGLPDWAWRSLLVAEGHMPTWVASFLAARLGNKGLAFATYDPRLGGAVVAATHSPVYRVGEVVPLTPEEIEKALKARKKTVVIGVLGDPNSGKSVFLHLLSGALKDRGATVLVQEADLTAPTQEWSLHAQEVRKRLKRYMEPRERLRWITESLSRLKESGAVDYVLADLGGGRPDLGVRVTRENQAILRYVDGVLIVSRNDSRNIDAWLNELATYYPEKRIYAVLESRLTGKAQARRIGRLLVGRVVGLDRNLYREGRIPRDTLRVVGMVADQIMSGLSVPVEEAEKIWHLVEEGHAAVTG